MPRTKTVPSREEIIKTARCIEDPQTAALYSALYLTAARVGEILPASAERVVDWSDPRADSKGRVVRPTNRPGLRPRDVLEKEVPTWGGRVEKVRVFKLYNEKSVRNTVNKERRGEDVSQRREKLVPVLCEREARLLEIFDRWAADKAAKASLFDFSAMTAHRRLKEGAGLSHPHRLRHARVTHLIADYGLDAEGVRTLAGWATTKPLETYSHLDWRSLARKMI